MKYYLVTFCKDWADEFYVNGSFPATEDEHNELLQVLEENEGAQFIYSFGTNEGWEEGDETIAEVLESDYALTEVSKEEYDVLVKYGTQIYGTCPNFKNLIAMATAVDDDDWDAVYE